MTANNSLTRVQRNLTIAMSLPAITTRSYRYNCWMVKANSSDPHQLSRQEGANAETKGDIYISASCAINFV